VSDVINRLANYEGGVVPHFDVEDDDDCENMSEQKKKKKKKAVKVVITHRNFHSYFFIELFGDVNAFDVNNTF